MPSPRGRVGEDVHVGALQAARDRAAEGAGVQPPARAVPAVDERAGEGEATRAGAPAGAGGRRRWRGRRRVALEDAGGGRHGERRPADRRDQHGGAARAVALDLDRLEVAERDRGFPGLGRAHRSVQGVVDDAGHHQDESRPAVAPDADICLRVAIQEGQRRNGRRPPRHAPPQGEGGEEEGDGPPGLAAERGWERRGRAHGVSRLSVCDDSARRPSSGRQAAGCGGLACRNGPRYIKPAFATEV